jgi:hypothetical protein
MAPKTAGRTPPAANPHLIRKWAQERGINVGSRGALPLDVITSYALAHGGRKGGVGRPLSQTTIKKIAHLRDHPGETIPWGSYRSSNTVYALVAQADRNGWNLEFEYGQNEKTGMWDVWATWVAPGMRVEEAG